MKLSKLMHVASIIVGLIGVFSFLAAIIGGSDGFVFGITKEDALLCAGITMLIAIWLAIGTVHHMMLEKKGEII